jgi:hypothetical protein
MVLTVAAVRIVVTVAVGRRRARVLVVGRRRAVVLRRARVVLGLRRLGLAVVVVVVVMEVMPRDLQVDAAKRLPFRQQFAELGVQFQQAKLRH